VETLVEENELARPDAEEEKDETERTRKELEKLVNFKTTLSTPSAIQGQGESSFIRYTPTSSLSTGKQRIIRLTNMAPDPLEPPKFKHRKAPPSPPSAPVPVMHSPPRKPSAKDLEDWKIPPCISNWKNNKGYTIPLDKRLAADGRGLQEVSINDNFAKLSEALYLAERTAREQVTKRAEIERRLRLREQEKKEEMLRQIAQEARRERAGSLSPTKSNQKTEDNEEELKSRSERDQVRRERRKEIDRELRIQRNKSTAVRNLDRDVTEQIALGMAMPQKSSEVMYDQRLFNQTEGLDAGFGDDEAYNIYTKPLFQGSSANQLYRPKKELESENYGTEEDLNKLKDTSKFRPDKGFSGAEAKKEARSGPIAFEKDKLAQEQSQTSNGNTTEDLFGLDAFLSQAKTQSVQKKPLDKIGQGTMHAATTSSGSAYNSVGSKRSRIDFQSSSSSSSKKAKTNH
jgi:SNW domain-containing protein 1